MWMIRQRHFCFSYCEVRVSGVIEPKGPESFELSGDVFCPQGTCDAQVDATFRTSGPQTYKAETELDQGTLTVELQR
jgi:hypothetical protein